MNRYIGIFRRSELFYIRSELEAYGLLPLEGKVIYYLGDDCLSQEEVCAHFDMDKGRIARTLSELEEKGFVCRKINGLNKRKKLVTLTPKGEQMRRELCKIFQEWDEICYSGFTDEERSMHQEFLRRIAGNVMNYRHKKGE